MKKIILWYVFVIIVVSFHSCTDGPGRSKDLNLMSSDTILSQYNHGRAEWERAVKEEGMVTITSTIAKITIEVKRDSVHETNSYFLQMDSSDVQTLSMPASRAEVLYLDKHLIVNSLDSKQVYYFRIKTEQKPAYLNQIKNMKEFTGFGLGLISAGPGFMLENAPTCSCIFAGSMTLCSSAGDGGLSCGTGNNAGRCRVVCSGATFACCDSKTN